MTGLMIVNALTSKNLFMADKSHHAPKDGRYQGLRKPDDWNAFSRFVPHTMVRVTIEPATYRNRPHRIIFWGELNGEPHRLWQLLATDEDLQMIYQTFKNRYEETIKNG